MDTQDSECKVQRKGKSELQVDHLKPHADFSSRSMDLSGGRSITVQPQQIGVARLVRQALFRAKDSRLHQTACLGVSSVLTGGKGDVVRHRSARKGSSLLS